MTRLCKFEHVATKPDGRRVKRCTHPQCGRRVVSRSLPGRTFARCRGPGLGNRLARLLSRVGITPKRWKAFHAWRIREGAVLGGGFGGCLVRGPLEWGDCGCKTRQAWLNERFPW